MTAWKWAGLAFGGLLLLVFAPWLIVLLGIMVPVCVFAYKMREHAPFTEREQDEMGGPIC